MTRPWTEAHRREALRRTYEIAAEMAGGGLWSTAACLTSGALWSLVGREQGFRFVMSEAAIDRVRIAREVKRVRALAEGRLVREASERWRVYTPNSGLIIETDDGGKRPSKALLGEHLRGSRPDRDERCSVVHVHVTRIRRA